MAPLSVLLLVAMLGLGSGQYFYHVPMPVPFFVPEMVPMYMPVLTRPSDIVPDLASRTGGVYIRDPETLVGGKRPKTYMKVFNDRLPGGVGRGHIYESHLPGQDEFSSSYGTVQSFGSPNSQAFMTSNSDSKSFSRSWSSETSNGRDPIVASIPRRRVVVPSDVTTDRPE